LFLSVVNLHANQGTGNGFTALKSVFGDSAPTESAFSQMRSKVSWSFFESVFTQSAKDFCQTLRPTYKGYFLTAVDGDQYLLERTKDALICGFKGQKCGNNRETYGLKMYLTLATCMISGAPIAITIGQNQHELKSGIESTMKCLRLFNVDAYDKVHSSRQIFTYDRLYLSSELIAVHTEQSTHFIARCKTGSTFSEIVEFVKSGLDCSIVEINGVKLKLIRATHKTSTYYYATNILDETIDNEAIGWMYLRRWESEVVNCHGVKILGIERFHSKKINGIFQEIYSAFWTLLVAKSNREHVKKTKEDFDKKFYRRQNTKRVCSVIFENVSLILNGMVADLCIKIEEISDKFTRKIQRLSRNCIRERKYMRQKKYPQRKAIEISP
jgi:Transposase DDE domain